MKTLTKISLKSASVLDDKQLKQIYGGSGTTNITHECTGLAENKCLRDVKCSYTEAGKKYEGHCVWVKPASKCSCATISTGDLEVVYKF